MSLLLRVAAALSALWALAWVFTVATSQTVPAWAPMTTSFGSGLAIANLGFGYLFWRASFDPYRERTAIYVALLVFALRAAKGIYEVLYVLDGPLAVTTLVETFASTALFVGILNALPSLLRTPPPSSPG